MGHYTIRTNDDEDQAIKKAQEATGQASASKTFMTATRLLDRMENGDVLIVTKLDRLGRNAMDVRKTVE